MGLGTVEPTTKPLIDTAEALLGTTNQRVGTGTGNAVRHTQAGVRLPRGARVRASIGSAGDPGLTRADPAPVRATRRTVPAPRLTVPANGLAVSTRAHMPTGLSRLIMSAGLPRSTVSTGLAVPSRGLAVVGLAGPVVLAVVGFPTPATVTMARLTTPTHWLVVPAPRNAVRLAGFHDVDLDFVSSMWARPAEGSTGLARARVAFRWRALSILLDVNSQYVVDSGIL